MNITAGETGLNAPGESFSTRLLHSLLIAMFTFGPWEIQNNVNRLVNQMQGECTSSSTNMASLRVAPNRKSKQSISSINRMVLTRNNFLFVYTKTKSVFNELKICKIFKLLADGIFAVDHFEWTHPDPMCKCQYWNRTLNPTKERLILSKV